MRKVSVDELNSDKNRMERLRQEELGKVGENDLQRAARLMPFVGPSLDYHYGKISGEEFATDLGKEGLEFAATAGVGNIAVSGIKAGAAAFSKTFLKSSANARFARNLQGAYSSKAASASASRASASVGKLEKNSINTIPDEFVGYGLPWTSWNQYPKVVLDGKTYAKIGDRLYTEHAVGRMLPSGLGRKNASCTKGGTSMSPNFVEEVIRKGNRTVETTIKQGKQVEEWVFTLEDCKVVTQNEGNLVVTVHSRSGGAK